MEPKLSTVFKKIKTITIKILKKLWNNLLLLMIFFLVLDLIFGAIFFLNYYWGSGREKICSRLPNKNNTPTPSGRLYLRKPPRNNQNKQLINNQNKID